MTLCQTLQYSFVQKLVLGRSLPHTLASQRFPGNTPPSLSSLSGSLPSRSLFGAVPNYYRRSLQYSSVQKLLLGRSLPHTLAFQRSLRQCVPPLSSFSGSAIEVFLRRCTELLPEIYLVFIRAEAIFWEISPTYASFPEVSLEMRPSLELSLGLVAIEVSLWRCTELSSIRSYRSSYWGDLFHIS